MKGSEAAKSTENDEDPGTKSHNIIQLAALEVAQEESSSRKESNSRCNNLDGATSSFAKINSAASGAPTSRRSVNSSVALRASPPSNSKFPPSELVMAGKQESAAQISDGSPNKKLGVTDL